MRMRELGRLARSSQADAYAESQSPKEDKGISVPLRVSWSQFLRKQRWRPQDLGELPHDYLCQEWFIFCQFNKNGQSY